MISILTKINELLLFVLLSTLILYYGQELLIPITIAILFALLLLPITQKLEKYGLNRTVASLLCILIVLCIASCIMVFFSYQLQQLIKNIPEIKHLIMNKFDQLQSALKNTTFDSLVEPFIMHIKAGLARMLASFSVITLMKPLGIFMIALLYTFFFLTYRGIIYRFILKIMHIPDHNSVEITLLHMHNITSSYIRGMCVVIIVLMILDSLGLYIIGIPYPLLWGIMASMTTIIPYIGVFIGAFFPSVMALLSDAPLYTLGSVWMLFLVNQLLENNILTPYIIGSYIHLNPLITLTCAFIGGLLWGIPGMILFIPMGALIKAIMEHMRSLKGYAHLWDSDRDYKRPSSKAS